MPIWAYNLSPFWLALVMVIVIQTIAVIGLFLTRRFLLGHYRFHDGVNDAISGTVQTVGVFYGITVGLIAVGVWNTSSNASDLVSKEAAAIGTLYRDIGGYPSPQREEMRSKLHDYTVFIIDRAWPAQKEGRLVDGGTELLDQFQAQLYSFEPKTTGQTVLHGATLTAYNTLIEYRRLRIDAVQGALSSVMWSVIWVGAAISIGVAYLYRIEDPKLHATLIILMAAFLAIVLFMIVINDRPFFGTASVSSEPYRVILERLIKVTR